ncbi:hypothetical protein B296_00024222 [Ensete ventricosum]|uniref:Uncharacterized protein n=1 Tax=Ensete ventricosum TaxID=4639 RepID=A0A426YUP3_ENSVE|nr:hypothetical protein B296_00024222 [Ensete ventricosum]
MARIAFCSFNPSPSLSPAARNPSRRLPLVPLPLRLRFSWNRIGGRRPLAAVVARYGGGGGYRPGPSRRRPRDGRAAADPDYDPALDLDRIKSSSVRLLDEQQNMAILSLDADPPVLRLFESTDYKYVLRGNKTLFCFYRKHKYEQQKKKRVQQKRSAANRMDIKELKMGYDSHGINLATVRKEEARKKKEEEEEAEGEPRIALLSNSKEATWLLLRHEIFAAGEPRDGVADEENLVRWRLLRHSLLV